MKHKRRQLVSQRAEKESINVSDQLDEDLLSQLQAAKFQLKKDAERQEEERQAQKRFERQQREKNKSFEELLDEYGDRGSKY